MSRETAVAATKTRAADPVADAREALTAAQQTHQDAHTVRDGYKERILAGDVEVSTQQYADAAHALEVAALREQAAAAALQRAQHDARRQRLTALADQTKEKAGTPDAALNAMKRIEEAVADLVAVGAGRQQLIAHTTATMRKEGVPEHGFRDTLTDEHAHLGWKLAGMGHGDTLYVGDRVITDVNVGKLIGAAIDRGCQAAGRNVHWLRPVLEVNGNRDIAQDPAAWLARHY